MTPRESRKYNITWTNNRSQPIEAKDFRNIILTIVGTGTATVLVSADKRETPNEPIDFTVPSTLLNSYITAVLADIGVPNTYATSLVAAGDTKMAEVNTNVVTWFCITRSAETLDGFVTISDNA